MRANPLDCCRFYVFFFFNFIIIIITQQVVYIIMMVRDYTVLYNNSTRRLLCVSRRRWPCYYQWHGGSFNFSSRDIYTHTYTIPTLGSRTVTVLASPRRQYWKKKNTRRIRSLVRTAIYTPLVGVRRRRRETRKSSRTVIVLVGYLWCPWII